MICSKCNQVAMDAVLCSVCKGYYHFACAGVAETTYRKMTNEKKVSWRCVSCRTGNNSAQVDSNVLAIENKPTPTNSGVTSFLVELQEGFAAVLKEIKELRADFSLVQSDLQACKDGIVTIDTKLNEVESRFSDLEDRVVIVEKKTDLVAKLQSDLNAATAVISTLQQDFDAREQYSRMNNIEISGLPFKKGENLISVLQNIYTVVGLNLETQFIDSIQRVRRFHTVDIGDNDCDHSSSTSNTREPAVIVKFTRRLYKDQLLSAVRARRGITTSSIGFNGPAVNLYLGDHLTPANKLLLKRARELKKDNKLTYLWIRDCKILARRTGISKVLVINKNFDFNKIN